MTTTEIDPIETARQVLTKTLNTLAKAAETLVKAERERAYAEGRHDGYLHGFNDGSTQSKADRGDDDDVDPGKPSP